MKSLALLFALSLLILPNPTHSTRNRIRLPTVADVALASDTPVLDTDGVELRAGGVYNVFVAVVLLGLRLGGLSTDDTECPSDVIIKDDSLVDPIIITPADPDATLVLESTFLNLKFNISIPQCENNGSWQIQYDHELEQQFVKTGDIVRSLFKIEPVVSLPDLHIYKITYCPFDVCYNVSAYYDEPNDALRLALSHNSSLPLVFQKVTPAVLDTDGEELLAGGVYNIISIDEPVGEVGLVKLDNTTECPTDVILQNDNNSGGEDRIMFTPRFPITFVGESTYLSIKFSPLQPTPLCQNNLSWVIQNDTQIVKTGDNVLNLFKIERIQSQSGLNLYKITYCPTTTLCYNVSTYKDPSVNANRLALSNHNFVPVVFKKPTNNNINTL